MGSSTTANQAGFQDAGKPLAEPVYLVDANGNPISSTNALNVNASFSASSIAINDPTTTTQKASVDASGNLHVQAVGAGTAGSPSGGVVSIQGVASGTVVPVSGTVTATNPSVGTDGSAIPTSSTLIGASDGTNLQQLLVESSSNRNLRTGIYSGANEATVTGANALKVDPSGVTQPISAASLPLPAGASTAAKQPALGTAGTASSDVISVQGIASMTALSVAQTTGSNLHAVLDSGSTTVVTQATSSNLNAQVVGAAASGASNTGNPVKAGGAFNSTQPTVTNGQTVDAQYTARGAAIVATGVDALNINNVSGTVSLPTGAATAAKQPALGTAGTASSDVISVQGVASMTALTVAQTTGTNLHTVLDSGSTTAVTQATGSNLHAVLDSGSTTAVTQATGSNLHAVLDSGSTTAVTQATAANLNATATIQAVTGTSLAADVSNTELRVSNYVKTSAAGDTALTLGQTNMAGSLPVTMANNQGAIGSVVVQTVAGTALVADQTNSELRVSLYGKNSAAGDTAVLVDSTGRVLVGRSCVAVYTLASTTTSGTTQNSGDLTVGAYTEISIDINTTAQAGTNPTIQYYYERKGADNIYYVLWQSNSLTAATNTLSTSIGTGQAYNQSLGLTGRLRWVIGGTATPTFTHSLNIYGK